mgnify:CR=1 FL=1
MKKSKLITGLSAAFVSAMALMSCSTLVKAKSGVILTINGEQYTAEDLFGDQKTPAAAEAKFNAVYKVAVRAYFKTHTDDNKEIERQVKVKMNEQKATAKSNADKNGTSYDVEWKKILKENGVDSTKKLQDKFEYEFQKEKFEDHFYEDNYDNLRSGTEEDTAPGFVNYFEGKQPYHMKHILVKVDGIGSNDTTGEITKEQALKLYNVIYELAKGTSFENVSKIYSDDTAAVEAEGSLGIMSRDTSFVDDFKLGTYFYEAFYGHATSTDAVVGETERTKYDSVEAKKALKLEGAATDKTAGGYANRIKTNVKDPTTNETIGVIPYEAALMLKQYAEYEYKDSQLGDAGISESDFKAKYLPRNVIFNKYFNKHNIMVIAPAKMHATNANDATSFTYGKPTSTETFDINENGKGSYRSITDKYGITYNDTYVNNLPGFSYSPKNEDTLIATENALKTAIAPSSSYSEANQKLLRDKNGRLILVFRSGTGSSSNDDSGYQGIHFVVIERSPFVRKEYDGGDESKYFTTNDEYYTQYYPEQSTGDKEKHHPTYNEYVPGSDENEWKHTYANYIMTEKDLKGRKDRADKVKTELKNCMPNLNTFIYDYLIDEGEVEFDNNDQALAMKDCIDDWIKITREDATVEKERNWNNNWQNYCYSLEAKTALRAEEHNDTVVVSELIPEFCINAITSNFTYNGGDKLDALSHMFGVGGVFHD